MTILGAFMVPHPPIILPEVGRGEEARISATTSAYQEVARRIAELKPDTILLTSPHTILYMDYFLICIRMLILTRHIPQTHVLINFELMEL